jgi:cytochrome c-type biogenesis protein CcmI
MTLPAGQSSIVGILANGTAGANVPVNQPLTLYALTQDGSSILFTRTVASDAGGQFAFDQLDPSPTTMYAIQTQYLKAYYTSEPLTFAHGGVTLTVPITVYETTTDAAAVSVEQMHMFFDFAPGNTAVGQLFIVSNSGDRAYIGTDGTSLHLPLPPGATNVRFQDGELGGRYQSVSGGFADTEAIVPGVGTVQILASYDLPYDGKKLDMSLPMAYPVKSVNVLVPDPGPKLTSPQLTSAGSRQTQGGNMLNYVGGNLAAGASLALQISGAVNAPATSGTPAGSTSTPWVLIASAALLLVAVGIVAFVWLRQQREAVEEEAEDPEAQREELLDAIAELDDDFEAGRVAEADYRQQRTEFKAELVELMKADE